MDEETVTRAALWDIIEAKRVENRYLLKRIEKLNEENRELRQWKACAIEYDRMTGLLVTKTTDQIMREAGVKGVSL